MLQLVSSMLSSRSFDTSAYFFTHNKTFQNLPSKHTVPARNNLTSGKDGTEIPTPPYQKMFNIHKKPQKLAICKMISMSFFDTANCKFYGFCRILQKDGGDICAKRKIKSITVDKFSGFTRRLRQWWKGVENPGIFPQYP